MDIKQPDFSSFVNTVDMSDEQAEPRSFDRMMFDICGEVGHLCTAFESGGHGFEDALSAFDRSCSRVYSDPAVSPQRKSTLKAAEWILKSWCLWDVPGMTKREATRWFDAWRTERNMALLQL